LFGRLSGRFYDLSVERSGHHAHDEGQEVQDKRPAEQGLQKGGIFMSAEENKAVVRRLLDVWEQGNIDLIDELVAPDYVNHSPATPEQPTGPEGLKGVVTMFRSAIPDLKIVVEDMIAEGDKVVLRYTLEGTHEGELFGVPPTGQRLSIKSISVERVSEGKIREHWRVTDSLDMMQQLGVIPAPEHA
jgi:steroid delta-isomerase-like uncharacterized protein